jgi:hypothetical protein
MNEINFIDKSFDREATETYSISLQANQNGLTYCIFDEVENQYILFRKHRFDQVILVSDLIREITGIFAADEILSLNYKKVRFLGFTQQSTLIPEELFDLEFMADYLVFNHAGDVHNQLFHNHISPPGIYNIFALSDELVSSITLHFKKVEFASQTTTFIRHIAHNPHLFRNDMVYVGLNPDFFDIACTGGGKLKLYNTFQYTNENDLLYYILFVYNKTGFEPRKVPLNLSGELSSKLRYTDMLREFLPELKPDEAYCISEFAPGLKQLDTSRYLNLLNLHLCASLVEHSVAGK